MTAAELSDLAPEDRRRLAREAERQAAAEAAATDAAKAARRRERMAALMSDRDHRRGCPQELAGDGRLEAFGARKPPATARNGVVLEPAREVTVVRCIECAGQVVIDRPYAQVFEQKEADE